MVVAVLCQDTHIAAVDFHSHGILCRALQPTANQTMSKHHDHSDICFCIYISTHGYNGVGWTCTMRHRRHCPATIESIGENAPFTSIYVQSYLLGYGLQHLCARCDCHRRKHHPCHASLCHACITCRNGCFWICGPTSPTIISLLTVVHASPSTTMQQQPVARGGNSLWPKATYDGRSTSSQKKKVQSEEGCTH